MYFGKPLKRVRTYFWNYALLSLQYRFEARGAAKGLKSVLQFQSLVIYSHGCNGCHICIAEPGSLEARVVLLCTSVSLWRRRKYIGFIIDDSVELAYAFFYVPPSSPYMRLSRDVPPEVFGKATDESEDDSKKVELRKKDGTAPRMRWRILFCTYALLATLACLVSAAAVRLT